MSASKIQSSTLQIIALLVALTTIALEFTQIRIVGALFPNDYVFSTITTVMLGFAISCTWTTIFFRNSKTKPFALKFSLFGFLFSSIICFHFASQIPLWPISSQILQFLICLALLVIPYVFAGVATAILFEMARDRIHRLYVVNLIGSAIGIILFFFLLTPFGPGKLIWLLMLFILLAFFLSSKNTISKNHFPYPEIVTVIAFSIAYTLWHSGLVNEIPIHKFYNNKVGSDLHKPQFEFTSWTPTGKIDVLSDSQYDLFSGYKYGFPTKTIVTDQNVATLMATPKLRNFIHQQVENKLSIIPFNIQFLIRPAPLNSLVIGVGGGLEVLSALEYGAKNVTGVEINPAIFSLITDRYRDYLEWPKASNVKIINTDGRQFAKTSHEKFNTITIFATDTFSPPSSPSYVLAENYLYTVEAFEDYFSLLQDDGILTIGRSIFQYPRETIRLVNLYLESAKISGIKKPSQSIMVLAFDPHTSWDARFSIVLLKKTPFNSLEVKTILNAIADKSDYSTIYLPQIFSKNEQQSIQSQAYSREKEYFQFARQIFEQLICAPDTASRQELVKKYMFNIAPVYDDSPFFFHNRKLFESLSDKVKSTIKFWEISSFYSEKLLYLILLLSGFVGVFSIIGPLLLFFRTDQSKNGLITWVLFFAAIGFGFMFNEIGMIQKFSIYLGNPSYSFAAVMSALFLSCAIGCGFSSKEDRKSKLRLQRIMLKSAVGILFWTLAIQFILGITLSWSLPYRIGICFLSIIPVGIYLGMPFAVGLSVIGKLNPSFIAWAWGINGIAGVIASVLSLILAIKFGFNAVLISASLLYFLGFFLLKFQK